MLEYVKPTYPVVIPMLYSDKPLPKHNHDDGDGGSYRIVRVKRWWVPEAPWRWLCTLWVGGHDQEEHRQVLVAWEWLSRLLTKRVER